MKKLNKFTNLLLFLLALNMLIVPCVALEDQLTVYQELVGLERADLDIVYENTSFPEYDIYLAAINLTNEYPMYSYTLLLECRKHVIEEQVKNSVDGMDGDEARNLLLSTVKKDKNTISERMDSVEPKTIASSEWKSLAKANFDRGEEMFEKLKESNFSDMNTTIAMAASTHLYLHKTDNLLTMAELRNNGTISFDPAELLYAEQVYASEQIEIESNKEEPNSNLLDMSQSYYDAENYYFALMLITEANVSVDAPNSEFDDIAVAEQRLNLTKKVLSSIREEGDIDAPLVQLKVELAVLRLEDAKKERVVVPSLLISSVIQEVTIANEQLDVLQDLKKNIGNIPHEEIILQEEASTDTMFTPVGLFPLIGLVVAYLVRRN